ncbi:hypothetical protein A2U01_0004865 [Trifolium medium]|uniref:Uncharacterized protein n=1 Tax=Trifolium medium TaxID=97028 RepID=A0A392MAB1_9FABA|nr:hypothetical protein [Trifolium medium]
MIYSMMTTIIPRACIDVIQRMQHIFIWGDTEQVRKYHVVGWDILTKPKNSVDSGSRWHYWLIARSTDPRLWKAIVNVWSMLEKHSFWLMGNATKCQGFALVDEFGVWNMDILHGLLPTHIIERIATLPPPSNNAEEQKTGFGGCPALSADPPALGTN